MKLRLAIFFISALCGAVSALPQSADSSLLAVPAPLTDNVAFWKKIYTEIPLTEGILHDRDYPLVIYKAIDLRPAGAGSVTRFVENEKNAIVGFLTAMQSQPESTWTREEKDIARLYKDHAPEGALAGAQERVRLQQGQKERFREGLERSTAFIDTIRSIFAQYNIPRDLAYLPHVESSFNTEAYSKVGAAGLWQFMRGTGRLFLKINYLIDERRDPVASTVAAARLLRSNYEQLQAWPLAITAYNHGVNGMKRAVEAVGSRDISDIIRNYRSPSFQFASKNFYACFLAASSIARNPGAYFNDLHCAPRYEFKTVTLPSFMRPSVVCASLKIPLKTLMDYNPSLRSVVFFKKHQIPAGFTIRIPLVMAQPEPEKLLAAVPDSLKSDAPERSQYYSVQRGDNLFTIASRLGISVSQLAFENNITRNNRIYAGQVLRIPSTTAAQAKFAMAQPETASPEPDTVVPQPLSQPAPVPPPAAPVEEPAVPSAKKPAMIWAARRQLSRSGTAAVVTVSQESIADSLKDVVMARADTLPDNVRGGKPVTIPEFDVSVYNLEVTLSPAGNTAVIKVSVDETIGHYADWLDIPTYRIRQLNRLGARSEIRINGALSIPADQDMLGRFVKARLEYHMALEEDFYSRYKVGDVRVKIIRRGEVLWTICNDTDQIPLWLFAKYNKNADLSTLQPGMRVWIPVIEEKTERDFTIETGRAIGVYPVFEEPVKKGVSPQLKRTP
jgi:membrane-bound lytic murein transglycosylase D